MLCYVMLCYVMLCYVMLCYVMLCYVMLCYVISSFILFWSGAGLSNGEDNLTRAKTKHSTKKSYLELNS